MGENAHRTVERHCDVAVIGGSVAGLAAALQVGRQRRSVIVVDSGPPRIAPAAHLHGSLGREALSPVQLVADGRDEVRSHGGEVLAARADQVTREGDRFRVHLVGGHSIIARHVLAATDPVDELPDIEGLAHHSHQVSSAAEHGNRVADMICVDLAREDLLAGARPSANEADWDHRYADDQMWSGNPNGTLVHEAGELAPGSALDVGAGEGGDAVWLAEQGWLVTASDVSRRALQRIDAVATQRDLSITCLHADANTSDAFPGAAFDLVSAQYASIPRTPDQRGVRNVLDAVAPGGTLVVVSHDLEPMRRPVDVEHESRPFDADAYVRVEDFAAVLAGSPDWEVEIHETRPRPPGAVSGAHHVDDVILRARRSGSAGR